MAAPPKGQPPNGNGSEEPRAQTTREAMAAAKSARSQVATYAERASELHPGTSLVLASDQPFWTTHQLAALQHMGVAGASVGDLQVFMHQSVRTQLDPFSGLAEHPAIGKRCFCFRQSEICRDTHEPGLQGHQAALVGEP